MSKLRFVAAVLLLALLPTLLFAGKKNDVKALEERVAELEATVEAQQAEIKALLEEHFGAMTKKLDEKFAGMEKTIASAATSGEERERQASVMLAEVNKAIKAGNYDKAKTQMADLQKKYASTNTAKRAARLQRELAIIGKEMPDDLGIEMWFQGESDFDTTGSDTTLLVFWETWCPHCAREVPKLQSMWDKYKDQGLQLVGLTKLTRSSTQEGVSKFIEDKNLSYPIAKEDGQATSYFGVSGIPAAAVVKNGKVVWRGHPANISDKMLQDWM